MTKLASNLAAVIPPPYGRGYHVIARNLIGPQRYSRVAVVFHHYTPGGSEMRTKTALRYPDIVPPPDFGDQPLIGCNIALGGQASLRTIHGDTAIDPGIAFCLHGEHPGHILLTPQPGFHDVSLFIAGDLAEELPACGVWRASNEVLPRSVGPAAVRPYVDLAHQIGDPAIDDATILRRALGVVEAVLSAASDIATPDDFAGRACRLLRDHPQPGYRMRDAARALGLTYESFRKHFRAVVGMAPAHYQLRQRMNTACAMLRDHGVAVVADRLGYSDPAVFSRQFKQVIGMSPHTFRSRHPAPHQGAEG